MHVCVCLFVCVCECLCLCLSVRISHSLCAVSGVRVCVRMHGFSVCIGCILVHSDTQRHFCQTNPFNSFRLVAISIGNVLESVFIETNTFARNQLGFGYGYGFDFRHLSRLSLHFSYVHCIIVCIHAE